MRLPEMLVNGLERFIPINKQDLAVLKGELTNKYFDIINSIKMKEDKNAPVQQEIDKIEKEIEGLDPHAPEFEEKLNQIDKLADRLAKKSLLEKTVIFLEKPLVRVGLMIAFLIFSRWLFKKMTEKPKDGEPENDYVFEQPQQNFQQGWNPYGNQPNQGGFWTPYQNPNQQFQNNQRR